MASAKREAELQRRVSSLAQDAQATVESRALLEVLTDRHDAADAALAVSPVTQVKDVILSNVWCCNS